MEKRIVLFFIGLFYLSMAVYAQKQILSDFHADPSAHVWDGKYWIYPSTDEPGSTSWKEMKRWHCYSSTNLVDWKCEGEIFNLDSIDWADHAAFAPDCMKWKGKYYFFFPAAFNIGVAVSDSPSGPFSDALDKPLIKNKEEGVTSFDPCIFIDSDNTPYLYYGGHGTVGMVKLEDDLIHRVEPITKLELKNYNEGIWVHKKGETYYFTYPIQIERDGLVKQLLAYSISKSPYGPFEYKGTFFDNDSRNSHHSIIEIKDKWYLFYHIQGPSPYERRVCVDYLVYNPDGSHNGPAYQGSPGPFKGGKTDLHEGGIRVPGFFVWKGKIQPDTHTFQTAHFADVVPTVCDICNIDISNLKIDGRSILPILKGQQMDNDRTLLWQMDLYMHFQNQGEKPKPYATSVATKGNWKMLADSLRPVELFNLAQDHREIYNLLENHPEIEEQLERKIKGYHAAPRLNCCDENFK